MLEKLVAPNPHPVPESILRSSAIAFVNPVQLVGKLPDTIDWATSSVPPPPGTTWMPASPELLATVEKTRSAVPPPIKSPPAPGAAPATFPEIVLFLR